MLQLGYTEVDYAAGRTLKVTPLGSKVLYGELKAQLATWNEDENTEIIPTKVHEEHVRLKRNLKRVRFVPSIQIL